MNEPKKSLLKQLLSYFMQGLLYIVPISVTAYVLYKIFMFIDGLFTFKYTGIGLLVVVAGITLIGLLGSTILARPILSYFTRLVEKAPLIKVIYSAVKDLLQAFVGKKRKFNKPVLVTINKENGIQKLGYITHKDLSELGIGDEKIAVYLPYSYGIMGDLYIVPKENVTPLNVSPTEFMKFIVSGGVASIDKSKTE